MPYKSDAQRRYFNSNRQQLEAEGVDVDEWNQSSKGMDLPEKAKKKKKQTEKQARVEPMPIWVNPPSSGRPLNPELVNSPGVQNLLKSLGMTSADLLEKKALGQDEETVNRNQKAANMSAVIVKGNPEYVADNPKAADFYAKLQAWLESKGYTVGTDPGEPYTEPPAADLWVGHSRGADRLRFAPEGTRTLSIGAKDGINHPDDNAMEEGQTPGDAHFTLTDDMLSRIGTKMAYTASTEACQECGAMHELGDDYCNRCGAYHSYGPDVEKKATLSELAKQAADISLVTVLDDEDNLLLIRRSQENTRSGSWENPLGHKDPGETDLQAAHRELKEETGLKATLLPKTTTIKTPDGKKTLRLFAGRVKGVKPAVTLSPEEHDKHRWVPAGTLSKIKRTNKDLVKNTQKLLEKNDMDVKIAELAKLAAHSPLNAKDLVDMKSIGGAFGDTLTPATWGGERAGRTQAMANAIDEPTSFGVRHPVTQALGYGTGGAVLGGLAGTGISALLQNSPHTNGIAGGIGGALGMLGGAGLAGLIRRREMRRIGDLYDQDNAAGKVNPREPQMSTLSALLAPFRGPHRTGQQEATKAMKTGDPVQGPGWLRNLLYTLRLVPDAGAAVALGHGYAQNAKTQVRSNDRNEKRKARKSGGKQTEQEDEKEKAASITELAKYAAQEAKKKDGDGDGKVNDGTDAEVSVKKQKSEAKKEKKHKARTKLGPIEHAYVADSVGAKSLENLGKKYQKMQLDPDNKYTDPYSQLLTIQGGLAQGLGERIGRGAARLSENQPWRLAAHFDPTAGEGGQAGLVGMLSGVGGGKDKAEGAKRRTAEAYAKFLKPHQDKLDPKAKGTDRETPWHLNMQANLADSDSDIAGHKYMRKERPWNYWLNPLDATGPIHELGDRTFRRLIAGTAKPDSTAGRFGMGAGGFATLGLLPLLMGGSGAQNKLRASASAGGMYHDVAKPEIKKAHIAIAELAKAAARHCDASPVVSEGEQAKREREKKTRTPQIEPASTF